MRRFFLVSGVVLAILFAPASLVLADYGLEETAGAAELPMGKSITLILGDVIGTALSLVSVLFFALMLYAGVKWMLARGDSGKAEQALDTIVAAIIGLIVVLASYAITNFVFKSVGGNSNSPSNPAPTADKKVWCYANATSDCVEKTACAATEKGPFDSKSVCELTQDGE